MQAYKPQKKKKDPNAPKQPLSAYFIFSSEERLKVKGEHPSHSICEVAKELGRYEMRGYLALGKVRDRLQNHDWLNNWLTKFNGSFNVEFSPHKDNVSFHSSPILAVCFYNLVAWAMEIAS